MAERNRASGAALLVVIWALAVIGAVVAAYFGRGLLEVKLAQDLRQEMEARALAQAGLACFIRRFLDDRDGTDDAGSAWLFAGDDAPPDFPEGSVEVRVADLGSRINLNLDGEDGLLQAFGGRREPVDAILDWRDTDDEPRAGGAEADYYAGLTPPIRAANGMFRSPEEALLVKGLAKFPRTLANETTVFGRANPNLIGTETWTAILMAAGFDELRVELLSEQFTQVRSDAIKAGRVPFAQPDDLKQLQSATHLTLERLLPYLTFTGRINPNLASERSLRAALAVLGVQVDKAKAIVTARDAAPFQELGALQGFLVKTDQKLVSKDWTDQVFTLQTTLAGVEIVGKTKSGALHRLVAVVERFHPPRETELWQCRFLYWREWPGEDFPVLPEEDGEQAAGEPELEETAG